MLVTNAHALPEVFMNFARSDKYDKGDADFSATQLIDSPRISALMSQHYSELREDLSERVFSMMGQALHHIAEAGANFNHISEERLFATYNVDGKDCVVSGQVDLQEIMGEPPEGIIRMVDFKVTSVFSAMSGSRVYAKWCQQLGIYKNLLAKEKNIPVENIEAFVCAFYRDWSKMRVLSEHDYPAAPAQMLPVNTRGYDTDEYITERIRAHVKAREELAAGEPISYHCTAEERWTKEQSYAVIKRGNKKATRVFDKRSDAVDWIAKHRVAGTSLAQNITNRYLVQIRQGAHTRCEHYCPVAKFCDQFNAELVMEWLEKHHGSDKS